MKHKLLLVLFVLTIVKAFSQNTYVFNGDGNWTDTTQWENGNYPGTTINTNDTVEILGTLTISENTNNDNRFIIFGGILQISSLVSSFINDVNGSITILDGGTIDVLSGTFENNSLLNNAVFNNGAFNVTNGEVINRGDFENDDDGILTISRTFDNESNGTLVNRGIITITGFSTTLINSGGINNSKNININNSSTLNSTTDSTFTNQNSGVIEVSTDSRVINNASNFSLRGKMINNGTIDNNTSIFIAGGPGELENNGTLNNNFGAEINNFGTVSGINTEHSGDFSNGGVLSPGNPTDATGAYKIDSFFSNYTQTEDGSLEIDLGGTIAGDSYDQVIVDRNATLDGTLNVSLVDGFEPSIGDTFTILFQGRNVSGVFSSVNLPALSAGKQWDNVAYSNTDGVSISVIGSVLSTTDFNTSTFKIYPNPVSNILSISGILNSSSASVFDLNGKKLLETELSNVNSSIDLTTIPSGIYLLNLEGKSFKFIKL